MSTTLGVAAGPFFRLDGPLPLPRSYTLLNVAQDVQADEHALAGVWLQSYPMDLPAVSDPCATGTFATKEDGGPRSMAKFAPFTAYLAGTCAALSIGPDPETWFLPQLRATFKVVESQAVERVLATGAGLMVADGSGGQESVPHLTDGNLDKLNGGTAVSPLEGLALLEDAIGITGRGGVIHATPSTVTLWNSGNRLYIDGAGNLRTSANGTLVVVGTGYIGAHPAGAGPTATEAWAFATFMPRYVAGPDINISPIVIPGEYRQALDTSTNVVTFRAERDYVITFDSDTTDGDNPPLQVGVLIDRTNVTP